MKIILVEDSEIELKRLHRLVLEAAPDCEAICFRDSEEAFAYFQAESTPPDIAFLDIQMPSISGIELARMLMALKQDLNIIFTTAYSSYLQDAFDMFASGYIQKPFSVNDIKQQLEHLRFPVRNIQKRFHATTLGAFDFYCDGVPVYFSSAKAKELLAYLIDRRGTSVTKRQMFAILFEDAEYTSSKQDYLKKIITSLKTTLTDIGCTNLLLHSRNCYSINTEALSCDLYEMLENGPVPDMSTPYMEQYSWAEYRF